MNGLQNTSTDSMFAPLPSKTSTNGAAEVTNAHSNPNPQAAPNSHAANAFADILVRLNTGDQDLHTTLPHVTFHGESAFADILGRLSTEAPTEGKLGISGQQGLHAALSTESSLDISPDIGVGFSGQGDPSTRLARTRLASPAPTLTFPQTSESAAQLTPTTIEAALTSQAQTFASLADAPIETTLPRHHQLS